MLVLGVDIAARKNGNNCGLSLIDASKIVALDQPADDLIWTRTIDGTDLRAVAAVVAEVKAFAAELREDGPVLAIERQFPGIRSGADPGTIEKLIGSRLRFEVVAEIRGVAFELVYPATWQTILNLLGADMPMSIKKTPKGAPAPVKPKKPTRDTKPAARLLVSRLYPGAVMGPDECDALLLARFAGWRLRAARAA